MNAARTPLPHDASNFDDYVLFIVLIGLVGALIIL
jgi:hypothetical protein